MRVKNPEGKKNTLFLEMIGKYYGNGSKVSRIYAGKNTRKIPNSEIMYARLEY